MTLKLKALAHYDRMIAWAEKQPKRNVVNEDHMEYDIGENWRGGGCVYCTEYFRKAQCSLSDADCEDDSRHCCNGLWDAMNHSKTWLTWVKRARKVREYIEKHG